MPTRTPVRSQAFLERDFNTFGRITMEDSNQLHVRGCLLLVVSNATNKALPYATFLACVQAVAWWCECILPPLRCVVVTVRLSSHLILPRGFVDSAAVQSLSVVGAAGRLRSS